MLQRLLFHEQAKYRDAVNMEKRRQEMKAHAEFQSFRLQTDFHNQMKQKQDELNRQRIEA